MRLELGHTHAGGLDRAQVIFTDAPEVFTGDPGDLRRRFFRAEALGQIAEYHPPVTHIQVVCEPATEPANSRDQPQWQKLNEFD